MATKRVRLDLDRPEDIQAQVDELTGGRQTIAEDQRSVTQATPGERPIRAFESDVRTASTSEPIGRAERSLYPETGVATQQVRQGERGAKLQGELGRILEDAQNVNKAAKNPWEFRVMETDEDVRLLRDMMMKKYGPDMATVNAKTEEWFNAIQSKFEGDTGSIIQAYQQQYGGSPFRIKTMEDFATFRKPEPQRQGLPGGQPVQGQPQFQPSAGGQQGAGFVPNPIGVTARRNIDPARVSEEDIPRVVPDTRFVSR